MALQRLHVAHCLDGAPFVSAAKLPFWQCQLSFCVVLPPGCSHLLAAVKASVPIPQDCAIENLDAMALDSLHASCALDSAPRVAWPYFLLGNVS